MSAAAPEFLDFGVFCAASEVKGLTVYCTPSGNTKAGNKKYKISVANSEGVEVFASIATEKTDSRGIVRRSVLMENEVGAVSPQALAAAVKLLESLI